MTKPHDHKPEAQPAAPADAKRSGRVAFDSRGNSVWEWQVQTGVYSRDVNTESVRKLDLDELSLADTAAVQGLKDAEDQKQAPAADAPPKLGIEKAGGGFNPYDNASASRTSKPGTDPYDNARLRADALHAKGGTSASASSAQRKPVSFAKQPPTELRKLSGWMKLKRVLMGKRD